MSVTEPAAREELRKCSLRARQVLRINGFSSRYRDSTARFRAARAMERRRLVEALERRLPVREGVLRKIPAYSSKALGRARRSTPPRSRARVSKVGRCLRGTQPPGYPGVFKGIWLEVRNPVPSGTPVSLSEIRARRG